MLFENPFMLWALPLVLIPLVIHWINVRKIKTVHFSDNRFIQSVLIQHKHKNTLRYRIILTLRMLLLSCIILAFSKPGFYKPNNPAQHLIIYLDNSQSTGRLKSNSTVLFHLQNRLKTLLRKRSPETRCILFTNDYHPEWLEGVRPATCIENIQNVTLTDHNLSLQEVLNRVQQRITVGSLNPVEFWYFSDGQQLGYSFKKKPAEPSAQNYFYIVNPDVDQNSNIGLDSCWLFSPHLNKGHTDSLYYQLTSWNKKTQEVQIQLTVNQARIAKSTLTIEPNKTFKGVFPIRINNSGPLFGALEIAGDTYTPDNQLNITLNTESQIALAYVSDHAPETRQWGMILKSDSIFKYDWIKPASINETLIRNAQVIVIDGFTFQQKFLLDRIYKLKSPHAVSILLPHRSFLEGVVRNNAVLNPWGLPEIQLLDTLSSRIAPPDPSNSFFKGVFETCPEVQSMPEVSHRAVFRTLPDQTLLKFSQGDPFLVCSQTSKALTYFFTSDLYASNRCVIPKTLSLPLFYQMVFSSQAVQSLYYWTRQSFNLSDLPLTQSPLEFKEINRSQILYPVKLEYGERLQWHFSKEALMAGHYLSNQIPKTGFSLNSDRSESNPRVLSELELNNWIKEQGYRQTFSLNDTLHTGGGGVSGFPVWKFLVILALVCVLAESFLIRNLIP